MNADLAFIEQTLFQIFLWIGLWGLVELSLTKSSVFSKGLVYTLFVAASFYFLHLRGHAAKLASLWFMKILSYSFKNNISHVKQNLLANPVPLRIWTLISTDLRILYVNLRNAIIYETNTSSPEPPVPLSPLLPTSTRVLSLPLLPPPPSASRTPPIVSIAPSIQS